jgi:hypothetical protein
MWGGFSFQTGNRKKRQKKPSSTKASSSPTIQLARQQTEDDYQQRQHCQAKHPKSAPKKTPNRVIDRWGVLAQKN